MILFNNAISIVFHIGGKCTFLNNTTIQKTNFFLSGIANIIAGGWGFPDDRDSAAIIYFLESMVVILFKRGR
jgi:hypothetical protein